MDKLAEHSHYRYHIEMLIAELRDLRNKPRTDTRIYLSLDEGEAASLDAILKAELAVCDRVIENRP